MNMQRGPFWHPAQHWQQLAALELTFGCEEMRRWQQGVHR